MKEKELSIGEFSKATGLSVKALRFYHERELLVPTRVDVGSGYRFYDQSNLEVAQVIVSLRELEFPLDDIKSILEGSETGDVLEFYVEYEWNTKDGVIHWTHHDPARRHIDGWLEYEGLRYE